MNFKNCMYFLSGMAGMAAVAAVCVALNNYYQHRPKIIHTINGYNIIKKERNGSTTVFTHLRSDVFGEKSDTLYLGLENRNVLDDIVLVDKECDGKIDIIRDISGISIREAKTLEEMFSIYIGAKEAFEGADVIFAKYKKEFAEKIKQAEDERAIMTGKKRS